MFEEGRRETASQLGGSRWTMLSPAQRVILTAPARLHFGLYGLAHGHRQFGGAGVMIRPPALRLELDPSEQFEVTGPDAERARLFANRWHDYYKSELPNCRLKIISALPQHWGLGSGTQLALAVGTALSAWSGRPIDEPQVLARGLSRGKRSAVGTYGFTLGGLIAERGWGEDDFFPPLDARIEFPEDWRFVLVQPRATESSDLVFGAAEENCLASLPVPPSGTTERLIAIAGERLIPAAATADFAVFSEALYEFNRNSGMLYAARQQGPYNGPQVTSLVHKCRELGVAGVGQSSWGPTVFALLPDETSASDFCERLRGVFGRDEVHSTIAAACNRGAEVQRK